MQLCCPGHMLSLATFSMSHFHTASSDVFSYMNKNFYNVYWKGPTFGYCVHGEQAFPMLFSPQPRSTSDSMKSSGLQWMEWGSDLILYIIRGRLLNRFKFWRLVHQAKRPTTRQKKKNGQRMKQFTKKYIIWLLNMKI